MADPRDRSRRTVLTGAGLFAAGALLTLSPLLLGRGSINRFVVVAGLVSVFIGGTCVINGAWDWLRGRGR